MNNEALETISVEALAATTGGFSLAQSQAAWQRAYTKGIAPAIHKHISKLPPNPDVHGRW
jgi:hypothetical protein